MTKKIKLVLSGSGTLYPVHIGAVLKLAELGYEISEICGTSGGAIVAAAIASGIKPNQHLVDMVKATLPGKNKLVDYSLWSLITRWGLVKGDRMEDVLKEHFVPTFSETKIPLYVVTTNIEREATRIFSSKTDPNMSVARAVRASMSIPGVFAPIKIEDELYVDGGITVNYALDIFGTGEDVIGLRFGTVGNAKDFKTSPRNKMKSVADFINANVGAMMEASNKEHMDDAIYARTIFLKSKHSGLNFNMTDKDVDQMIEEGYRSVERWVQKQAKFSIITGAN